MLCFVRDMKKCLNFEALRILYMGMINFFFDFLSFSDTDSIFLGQSDNFDNIILPGMEQEWEIVKKKWFVPDPKCKTPGF